MMPTDTVVLLIPGEVLRHNKEIMYGVESTGYDFLADEKMQ